MANKKLGEAFKTIGHFIKKWLKVILEVIAFILLVTKIIPENWVNSSIALFVLLSIAIAGLFISNFWMLYNETSAQEKLLQTFETEKNKLQSEIDRLSRRSKYAEILPMLNFAFQELHHALRKNHTDKSRYHEHLLECCQNIEKAFSTVTGEYCHVCIKMIIFPQDQIPSYNKVSRRNVSDVLLKTYCRSSSTSSNR